MKSIAPISNSNQITLPAELVAKLGIDAIANPLAIIEEIDGRIIIEIASIVPVRNASGKPSTPTSCDYKSTPFNIIQPPSIVEKNPKSINLELLSKNIIKLHNERFMIDPKSLPAPRDGSPPSAQMGGSRIDCGLHSFLQGRCVGRFTYWLQKRKVRIGVYLSKWNEEDLNEIRQRIGIRDIQFGGDTHRTIVVYSHFDNNHIDAHDKISTESVDRMMQIWTALNAIS